MFEFSLNIFESSVLAQDVQRNTQYFKIVHLTLPLPINNANIYKLICDPCDKIQGSNTVSWGEGER